jgi:replicative DNA helicase
MNKLCRRLIAQETGIDSQRLRTGKLQENEWPLFTHSIEVFGDTNIYPRRHARDYAACS